MALYNDESCTINNDDEFRFNDASTPEGHLRQSTINNKVFTNKRSIATNKTRLSTVFSFQDNNIWCGYSLEYLGQRLLMKKYLYFSVEKRKTSYL